MNLPNRITLLRFPLTAIFFIFFFDQPLPLLHHGGLSFTPYHHTVALFCFILACVSDWSDGYLARRRAQITVFGKVWDPIADKVLVATAWVAFVANNSMPAWVALVLLSRDFAVSGLRVTAAQQNVVLAAETGGKIKTIIQLVTIGVICAHHALVGDWGWKMEPPGGAWYETWLLFPACVISSLWSAFLYFRSSWSLLRAQ